MVVVDGALPYGLTGEEGQERIQQLFHRMRFLLPLARPFGMAARMSAEQHAEVDIELNEIAAALAPVLERVSCPIRLRPGHRVEPRRWRGGDGASRASLEPVLARNPNLRISAKVASNHSKILQKDFRAVAEAVREVPAADRVAR